MKTHSKTEKPKALSDSKLSGPAIRAFLNISEKWHLNDQDKIKLLGSPGRTTFYKWKTAKDAVLPKDTLERISYILGIYKALHLIFSDSNYALLSSNIYKERCKSRRKLYYSYVFF